MSHNGIGVATNSDKKQQNIWKLFTIIGRSLEDDDHFLTGVIRKADRLLYPFGGLGKVSDERRSIGVTAIGGNIDGEVAASRVLVPEA